MITTVLQVLGCGIALVVSLALVGLTVFAVTTFFDRARAAVAKYYR